MHSRGDARVPFDEGRKLAAAMHGAHGATAEAALKAAERDVLRLVAQGLDNGTTAHQFRKSAKAVRNRVSRIFDTLGGRTRTEAIVHVHHCEPRS